MKKYERGLNNNLNLIDLKPKYEQKYVSYLKRRYGVKRAKSFSRSISS
jgi:hypothetical protein